MERTLGNNGEMLQGRYITVTQEQNSFTEKMKKSKITENMCGSPHNVITKMDQQQRKKK